MQTHKDKGTNERLLWHDSTTLSLTVYPFRSLQGQVLRGSLQWSSEKPPAFTQESRLQNPFFWEGRTTLFGLVTCTCINHKPVNMLKIPPVLLCCGALCCGGHWILTKTFTVYGMWLRPCLKTILQFHSMTSFVHS